MNSKLLIISPHFPPANTPDCQRVRMSLSYFKDFGWDPTVLCIDSVYEDGILDDQILNTIPSNIKIVKTKAIKMSFTKYLGINSVYWRCLPYLYNTGTRLIKENKYDLIYFSTTIFPSMILGKKWKDNFSIPYVLDIQDPWFNDYKYKQPPGGKLKYSISQLVARIFERKVINNAEHIISVSPRYKEMYMKRYSEIPENKFSILPFGVSENDFQTTNELNIKQDVFNANDGYKHWVYIGRGGEDLYKSLRIFFNAVSSNRKQRPSRWNKIKIHFVGTSYSGKKNAKKTIKPLAEEMGVGDLVEEQTIRVSYLESIKLLVDSDLILIFGSNDLSYSPSKLYPYILSEKPMISIFHEESHIVKFLNEIGIDELTTYNSNTNSIDVISKLKEILTKATSKKGLTRNNFNLTKFNKYKASHLTRLQCEIFNSCIN